VTCRSGRERGSAAAFLAVLAVPLLLLFGLVLDGGRALEGKLRAKDAAAEAARAAANACDPGALRAQADCQISAFMLPTACQQAADSITRNAPPDAVMTTCRASPDGHVVTVGVQFSVKTTFLGLAVQSMTVRATQSARTYTGR
jgi:Flp pilus assembly protein TadG